MQVFLIYIYDFRLIIGMYYTRFINVCVWGGGGGGGGVAQHFGIVQHIDVLQFINIFL